MLSVSGAIRKNPGPIRVTGIIDSVRPPFKLLTKMYFICTNRNCRRRGSSQPYILDRPIFSPDDMRIAFAGGMDEYNRYLRCPCCRQDRELSCTHLTHITKNIIEKSSINVSNVALVFLGLYFSSLLNIYCIQDNAYFHIVKIGDLIAATNYILVS